MALMIVTLRDLVRQGYSTIMFINMTFHFSDSIDPRATIFVEISSFCGSLNLTAIHINQHCNLHA